jgi:hypothetical protein
VGGLPKFNPGDHDPIFPGKLINTIS